MRILFFSHYFPPEGNAPASRVYEMSRRCVDAGHEVTVITCAPNQPDGVVYEGYKNRLYQTEQRDGIRVVRIWTYLAANRGTTRRIINFVSFMVSAVLASLLQRRPDVIVATSPQFFCGWAGLLASWLRWRPFVLEIRDIWPESIVAVGAMNKPRLIRILEWFERRLYAGATHIVAVGNGYKRNMVGKGVPNEKVSIVTNGADLEFFAPRSPDLELKRRYVGEDDFVCAYIGTIGMASGLDVVLRAASRFKEAGRTEIKFLIVGDGAERESLQAQADELGLDNVILTGRQDKQLMPAFQSIADVILVHLRKVDLFRSVLPSKVFEAAAMERPIIMGVEGDAAELVRAAGAGICIEPENESDLLEALTRLHDDPDLARSLGKAGRRYITEHYNRDHLAQRYLDILLHVARREQGTPAEKPPTSEPS